MLSPLDLSKASKSSEIQEIDAAIRTQQCENDIRTLKARRNELASTTACLPPEILTDILIFARVLWPECCLNTRFSILSRCMHWIAITHVNTQWRNIALSAVELWTDPPFSNAPWTEEMIKRSNLQLSVIDFDFRCHNLALLTQALLHRDRIRKFSFTIEGNHKWNDLPNNLPGLEELYISESPGHVTVPSSLLSESGRLRKISINGCKILWPPQMSRSITHLILYSTTISATFPHFIDSLKSLTELQCLRLIMNIPSTAGHLYRPPEPTLLASLRELHIESLAEECRSFFHHITFPSNASVTIMVDNSQDPEDLPQLLSDMLSFVARPYADDLLHRSPASMIIEDYRSSALTLQLYYADNEQADHQDAMLDLAISITPKADRSNCIDIITTLFSCGLPLDDIKRVRLRGSQGSFTLPLFAQTVGKLANVLSLEADYTMASLIAVKALQLELFPNLTSLQLLEMQFTNPLTSQDLSDPEVKPSVSIEEFIDLLTCRFHSGVPIARLGLRECWHLDKEHLHRLRQVVASVECN